MEQEHNYEYKSPIAALLWSVMMTGFDQFYHPSQEDSFLKNSTEF